jgi:hypothetical protein
MSINFYKKLLLLIFMVLGEVSELRAVLFIGKFQLKKTAMSQVLLVHACNPSYS